MIYADTNFLSATFFDDEERHPQVERFLRRASRVVVVGELAELEAENVFARLTGRADSPAWRDLQSCLDTREWRREPLDWAGARDQARELFRRYSHRAPLGTLDLLHLAAARLAGCEGFASFDTGSAVRALASVLRFEVFPVLTARDRDLVAQLKRR